MWLLEHAGSDITDVNNNVVIEGKTNNGRSVWDLLRTAGLMIGWLHDAATVTALLRVMVLREDCPTELKVALSSEHRQVVEVGARLRVVVPAYLARRRALMDSHCPLLAPLQALVHRYEEPTTDELWATGLGANP
jgi:hypothetical protein